MLPRFGVCRRPTTSDCFVLCFASLESMKFLAVLHIAMLKWSGESNQSKEVNYRKNSMKNQALFSFPFSFFPVVFRKWSSCWVAQASESRGWFWLGVPSASANVCVTFATWGFQLPFRHGKCLLFLALSWFISVRKNVEELVQSFTGSC